MIFPDLADREDDGRCEPTCECSSAHPAVAVSPNAPCAVRHVSLSAEHGDGGPGVRSDCTLPSALRLGAGRPDGERALRRDRRRSAGARISRPCHKNRSGSTPVSTLSKSDDVVPKSEFAIPFQVQWCGGGGGGVPATGR